MFNPKWIIGRTITGVDMNPFRAHPESTTDYREAHDPTIYLDNGASLAFITEETETGDYGTAIIYRKPPKQTARQRCSYVGEYGLRCHNEPGHIGAHKL